MIITKIKGYLPATSLVAISVAFFVGGLERAGRRSSGVSSTTNTVAVKPSADSQLVAVVFAASTCGACRSKEFRAALKGARERVAALDSGAYIVGVSLDTNVDDGLAMLRKFGAFHEIIVGGNWVNHGAAKYIWEDFPGTPSVPHIVLLQRTVEQNEQGIAIMDERVLRRLVGISEIEEWGSLR